MAKKKTQKDLAQRIDPTYFRRWHPLRKTRFMLSAGLAVAAVLWVGGAWALGDESIYSNGTISRAHFFIENDCAKCHTATFTSVPDKACIECHKMGAHVPQDKGEEPACTSCHVEHKGRDFLHFVGDAHCNECHTDHKGVQDLDSHVEFKIENKEQHLKFNHKAHLKADLQEGPLACADCHVPDATGEHFAPISFDAHCARCHADRLDGDVDIAVPHGMQPPQLRDWISGAFMRAMRENGELVGKGANPMPGAGATRVPSWAEALQKRTDNALKTLVHGKKSGCVYCHEVEKDAIVPPAVPTNWYPEARFNHKAHRFEDCSRCHDMSENTEASTLELPKIAVCRDCHADEGAGNTCVTCHGYHPGDGHASGAK